MILIRALSIMGAVMLIASVFVPARAWLPALAAGVILLFTAVYLATKEEA